MKYGNNWSQKQGQSSLEYAFVIGLVVGVLLIAQSYFKRSMQGQLQTAGDQIADQYAYGLTDGHEHFEAESTIVEVTTPGWNHPTTATRTSGSYSSTINRAIRPLTETWPPE